VLTREAVLAEGVEGGFAAVYPVLKALEERGQVRRGYFVAGLGAAQFALPGAVDRLRVVREPDPERDEVVLLAATDPAQPFGASLPWPESSGRPARSAGALVVISSGQLVAYLERGGRSLVVFAAAAHHAGWAGAVADVVSTGRLRRLEIARIDGEPAAESPHADALRSVGFRDGYRGLVLGGR
jgi:ATP-dependent Lhr-like helicase